MAASPFHDFTWREFFLDSNPVSRSLNLYEIFAGSKNHAGIFDWVTLGIPYVVDIAWADVKDLTGKHDYSRERDNPMYIRFIWGAIGIPVGIIKFGCELGRGVLGFAGATLMALPMELLHLAAPLYKAWDDRHPIVLEGEEEKRLTADPVIVAEPASHQHSQESGYDNGVQPVSIIPGVNADHGTFASPVSASKGDDVKVPRDLQHNSQNTLGGSS